MLGLKGGPGSGNFGHAGRPGKVGGSAPWNAPGPAQHVSGPALAAKIVGAKWDIPNVDTGEDYAWKETTVDESQKGGPGSGNFGHAGRPGKVGGSGPAGSAPTAAPPADRAEAFPDYVRTPKLAAEISRHIPKDSEGKPVPVQTKTLYHVTRWENVEPIMRDGFDLRKIKPRWTNDYAVSLSSAKNLKAAAGYFMPHVPGATFASEKYAILEVTVKGRFFDPADAAYSAYGTTPQQYNRDRIDEGYDASHNVYVYNTQAIGKIRVVRQAEIDAAFAPKAKRAKKGGPGSGFFDHAGRPGQVGGSAPAGAAPGPERPARTFDDAEWDAKPVPQRLSDWAALSQEERDAMADAPNAIKDLQHERLAFAGERPTEGPVSDQIQERLRAIGDFIPPDAARRIQGHVDTIVGFMQEAGAPPSAVRDVAMEAVDSLAVQENEALGRTLGDHGTRHILSDMDMALRIAELHPAPDPPAQKAAIAIACVFHDTGYLTKPAQKFMDPEHPHWSAQHYDANVKPMVERALGAEWAGRISGIIETHATSDIDWNKPAETSVRLADNLGLFHKDKLPGLFYYVPKATAIMLAMGKGQVDVPTGKRRVLEAIASANLSPKVKKRLQAAAMEMGTITPKLTAGMLAGEVDHLSWNEDHLAVRLRRNRRTAELQRSMDLGQRQFQKFAKVYGMDPTSFTNQDHFELRRGGKVLLEANIVGEKIKALLQAAGAWEEPRLTALVDRWAGLEAAIPLSHLFGLKFLPGDTVPAYDAQRRELAFDPDSTPEAAFTMAVGRHVYYNVGHLPLRDAARQVLASGAKSSGILTNAYPTSPATLFAELYAAAIMARRIGAPELWLDAGSKARPLAIAMERDLFAGSVTGGHPLVAYSETKALPDFGPAGDIAGPIWANALVGRAAREAVSVQDSHPRWFRPGQGLHWKALDHESAVALVDATPNVAALARFVKALQQSPVTPFAMSTGNPGDAVDNFTELTRYYMGSKGSGGAGEAGVRQVCQRCAPDLADAYLDSLALVRAQMTAEGTWQWA